MSATEDIKAFNKLKDAYVAKGMKLNTLERFGYPLRRMRVKALASGIPEKSLLSVYNIILESVNAGFDSVDEIGDFLGLSKDDFLLKEIYFLREKGFLHLNQDDKLFVTDEGQEFMKDHSILQVTYETEFEFLVDGYSGKILETFKIGKENTEQKMESGLPRKFRDFRIIQDKFYELQQVFKRSNPPGSYLIDLIGGKDCITFDKTHYKEYFFLEYTPGSSVHSQQDPFVEVRNLKDGYRIEKEKTKHIEESYPEILYQLFDDDRSAFSMASNSEAFATGRHIFPPNIKEAPDYEELGTFETKLYLEEAVKKVKKALLIESPWIKRAVFPLVPGFRKMLKAGKKLCIIYGIDANDIHHVGALNELKKLRDQYPKQFLLVYLPDHLANSPGQVHGTHRKILIKDNEYFISGSFNFLSFNKRESDPVANETSFLFRQNVKAQWKKILSEYHLGNFEY